MKQLTIHLLALLLLSSCSEKNTTDPTEAYFYWSGFEPPENLELVKAQYWESAHWSKEYILYLKIKPTREWWNAYLTRNNMTADQAEWSPPHDAPEWFTLPNDATIYAPNQRWPDTRAIHDNETGYCYIYELQL